LPGYREIDLLEFLVRRILLVIPVVLGVSLLVFFLIHMIPGDPAVLMLGESAHPADIEKLQHDLGLDQPLGKQLLTFLNGLIHFDLGKSLHGRKAVTQILMERFPATIELTLISLLVAILIAFPLGIISAVRARTVVDTGSMFFALLGVSMPNFWLGPLLILLFSIKLDLLPVFGKDNWTSYILPAITLGTALAAILTRMIRSSLLEVIQSQYITTAYAKGLSPRIVILKHALRNALIPVVTILGLQLGSLLGGSIITETIFSWPGVGRELIQAIQGRDYPVVQGCVLFISFFYVMVNLLTDLTYGFLDPRIQMEIQKQRKTGLTGSVWRIIRMHPRSAVTAAGLLIAGWIVYRIEPAALAALRQIPMELFRGLSSVPEGLAAGLWKWVILLINTLILVSIPWGFWMWRKQDPRSWRRFARTRSAWAGLLITSGFLLLGLIGPMITPYDPLAQDLTHRLESPGNDHLLGTDDTGRDLLSRILDGSRISVKVGLIVTVVSVVAGTLIGMIAGLAGGWFDEAVMRCVDILLAFPGILLAIALVAVLGPDINNVILALCLMGWVGYARLARAQVLTAREEDYIEAARSLGASPVRLIFQHLLPNIIAPIVVQATLGMAGVIIAEAGLSFLGLGVQPPAPSWGGILNSGVEFFREGPHLTLFPGIAIMIVVMGLNFFGDGLRDALDPRSEN
jgi:peptide/nickel transport system permease protein